MDLPKRFDLKLQKSQNEIKEFESPEKQNDQILTAKSDLYSLGIIGLTLYNFNFSQTSAHIQKPSHCPQGLFEKLKALINKTPESRPTLNEIIDALDNLTNQGSLHNIDSLNKDQDNSNQNNFQQGIESEQRQNNINPKAVSQQQINQKSEKQISNNKKENNQIRQSISVFPEQIILQPKSEVQIRNDAEKIEYDFNPFQNKQDKKYTYF